MRITLPPSDEPKLASLLKTKNENIRAADMFLFFLEQAATDITQEEITRQKALANATDEQAYVQRMAKRLGLDTRKAEDKALMTLYLFKAVKELDASPYRENPYYQYVRIHTTNLGAWKLQNETYLPNELLVYDDVDVDPSQDYLEKTHLGFFKERFEFLSVAEKNTTWMSITPNEIETMKSAIDESRGQVVTFGLGLGYFAFMASLKPEVTSVTIVETNPDMIALFKKDLLPQFPHKEKIKIVQADAFEFAAKDMKTLGFDVAFVDLWHGGEDGLYLYLKMKKFEGTHKKTRFLYWLERSLLVMLRRCVLTLVEEELGGSTDQDYLHVESTTDEVINALHRLLKETSLKTYQNVVDLVTDENLKALAPKIL